MVLVVSPKHTGAINSIKDLAGKKVGVSAPGSSTDFFIKYLLRKNGVDPNAVPVIGVGLDATAVAAMEQGQVDAAIMLDPAVTLLQGRNKDLKLLTDTRTQKDTLEVFGGEYPGGSLYAPVEWIAKNEKTVQGLAQAIVATLNWIHSHSAEEIMAKMPGRPGRQRQAALPRGAQEHDPDVLDQRRHGSEGCAGRTRRVQPVGAGDRQRQDRPVEDLHEQVRRAGGGEAEDELGGRHMSAHGGATAMPREAARAAPQAAVEIEGVTIAFAMPSGRGTRRAARRVADGARGQVRRHRRALGLRQVHAAQRHRRAARIAHGTGSRLRGGAQGHQPARRLPVPAGRAAAVAQRAGERDARPRLPPCAAGGGRGEGPPVDRARGLARLRGRASRTSSPAA